jgi:hypothetical protein
MADSKQSSICNDMHLEIVRLLVVEAKNKTWLGDADEMCAQVTDLSVPDCLQADAWATHPLRSLLDRNNLLHLLLVLAESTKRVFLFGLLFQGFHKGDARKRVTTLVALHRLLESTKGKDALQHLRMRSAYPKFDLVAEVQLPALLQSVLSNEVKMERDGEWLARLLL